MTPAAPAPDVRAALRDASWFRRPNTRNKPLVFHVVAEPIERELSACGWPVVAREGERNLTDEAAAIAPSYRCQRPGCKSRWPAYEGRG